MKQSAVVKDLGSQYLDDLGDWAAPRLTSNCSTLNWFGLDH